jgi:porphobilinogen deaminase
MREICTSSLKRGRDITRQARYAVFRHIRGNPDTRFTVTYPYRCTLSTLPADGTLALAEASAGAEAYLARARHMETGVVLGEPGCA